MVYHTLEVVCSQTAEAGKCVLGGSAPSTHAEVVVHELTFGDGVDGGKRLGLCRTGMEEVIVTATVCGQLEVDACCSSAITR